MTKQEAREILLNALNDKENWEIECDDDDKYYTYYTDKICIILSTEFNFDTKKIETIITVTDDNTDETFEFNNECELVL